MISQFDYTVNDLGQRDAVNHSGSAFTDANTEAWNYKANGEVVTLSHSTNNGFDRSYQFDGIGNRTVEDASSLFAEPRTYSANSLNQPSSITTNNNTLTRSFVADGNLIDDGWNPIAEYTSSLPHFLTSSLPHFLTSSLPHFLTSSPSLSLSLS